MSIYVHALWSFRMLASGESLISFSLMGQMGVIYFNKIKYYCMHCSYRQGHWHLQSNVIFLRKQSVEVQLMSTQKTNFVSKVILLMNAPGIS